MGTPPMLAELSQLPIPFALSLIFQGRPFLLYEQKGEDW